MEKQQIEIAGYKVTQLSKTEFEAENKEQNLDFYFEINEENGVNVFVFDSEIEYSRPDRNIEPCLDYFQSEDIENAVLEANNWRRLN